VRPEGGLPLALQLERQLRLVERNDDAELRLVLHGPAVDGRRHEGVTGASVKVGYDFKVKGGSVSAATVTNAQLLFTIRCVDGSTPMQGTLAVPMPDQTYTNPGSDWTPSEDQQSSLVYQARSTCPTSATAARSASTRAARSR
jgi:hypothetical protein